jgi:hypothetical protein
MKAYRWLTLIAATLITALGLLFLSAAGTSAHAAPAATCDMRLVVELTPDVPNADDPGFLSSLLSNQAGYRLTLQEQESDSVVVLHLAGPGPAYECQNAVETLRKDARVLSVRLDPDDTQAVSVVSTPVPQEDESDMHLSRAGLGSLYWAARHPAQAWRLLTPAQPGDATGAYEDFRVKCASVTSTVSGTAACP